MVVLVVIECMSSTGGRVLTSGSFCSSLDSFIEEEDAGHGDGGGEDADEDEENEGDGEAGREATCAREEEDALAVELGISFS